MSTKTSPSLRERSRTEPANSSNTSVAKRALMRTRLSAGLRTTDGVRTGSSTIVTPSGRPPVLSSAAPGDAGAREMR